jgi:GTP-binding protein EngB required for normal cell division
MGWFVSHGLNFKAFVSKTDKINKMKRKEKKRKIWSVAKSLVTDEKPNESKFLVESILSLAVVHHSVVSVGVIIAYH